MRLIDHLPGAGTQHQPTYQTNGNMIIIITPTNHRLTSFSLDYSAVTSLKSLNAILFDDLLCLADVSDAFRIASLISFS